MTQDFIIKNNLTEDEKAQVTRILDHDASEPLVGLIENVRRGLPDTKITLQPNFEYMFSAAMHIKYIIDCVEVLTRNKEIYVDHEINLSWLARHLNTLSHNKLQTDIDKNSEEFLAKSELVYPVLFTLFKNSLIRGNAKKVVLSSELSGFPEQALYVPENASRYRKYLAMHLTDDGKGFPEGFDFLKALTTCIPERTRGFGLYFTGLIGKVLAAPIHIVSEPENCRVSLYHPVYESEIGGDQND